MAAEMTASTGANTSSPHAASTTSTNRLKRYSRRTTGRLSVSRKRIAGSHRGWRAIDGTSIVW